MKDLEMNWTKLTPDLKDRVLDIIVDGIFPNNYDFKNSLLSKVQPQNMDTQFPPYNQPSRSNFGSTTDNKMIILSIAVISIILLFIYYSRALF
jgi:hypothetical protein